MNNDLTKRIEALEASLGAITALLTPNFEVKILDPRLNNFGLPQYATSGSAAVDLRAMINEPITLQPGECKLIPSGIAVNMADSRYCCKILPRSGLGHKHGLVLRNLTGLIDSDYQGQLQMSIVNNGAEPFKIDIGDRIAQLMFTLVVKPTFSLVDEFSEISVRGAGGFGHSGKS